MTHTILIVDDEPNLLLTTTHILHAAGYKVIPTHHGLESLTILKEQVVDCMLVDLKMPQVDGISLIQQIRVEHSHLPIIIMTAHASLETAIEAVRQGARDYLIKPVDPAHLLERIRSILREEVSTTRKRDLLEKMQQLVQELHEVEHLHGSPPEPSLAIKRMETEHLRTRGSLMMNLRDQQAVLNGKVLYLSPTNFNYLLTLLNASPNPVPSEKLVQLSQGYEVTRHEAQEIVRWRIRELREIIEPDPGQPQYILTVRNVGYRLNVDEGEP